MTSDSVNNDKDHGQCLSLVSKWQEERESERFEGDNQVTRWWWRESVWLNKGEEKTWYNLTEKQMQRKWEIMEEKIIVKGIKLIEAEKKGEIDTSQAENKSEINNSCSNLLAPTHSQIFHSREECSLHFWSESCKPVLTAVESFCKPAFPFLS